MPKSTNYALRDTVLAVDPESYVGGCARFERASAGTLRFLVDKGLADVHDRQNNAPTLGEILAWLEAHSRFTAHGYVVTPLRSDVRVTVEGVTLDEAPTPDERADFLAFFRHADELEAHERCRAWFD